MRLGLLASISWVMSLTAPLFTVLALKFCWRDVILSGGGVFLLIKATIEIHDRLEAQSHGPAAGHAPAAFWLIVAQIVVLDGVFSLDSVITAIGMVDELVVMMAAVVIAVLVKLAASRSLTRFVNRSPVPHHSVPRVPADDRFRSGRRFSAAEIWRRTTAPSRTAAIRVNSSRRVQRPLGGGQRE